MKSTLFLCLFVLVLLESSSATEQVPQREETGSLVTAPLGRWRTVDDATGKVNSVVVIWEENGTLSGRIETLVNSDSHDSDPRCTHCDGAMKDSPLIGLRILWGLQKNGHQH